jgi:aryl-alcohol dehydrogenase-like predicted oxidoreductase
MILNQTHEYTHRFPAAVENRFFRSFDGSWLSSIGLGTYIDPVREMDEARAIKSIVASVKAGCNVIDTAANYSDGEAIAFIGIALRELARLGIPREELIVVVKIGYVPETVLKSGKFSLRSDEFAERGHSIHPSVLHDQLKSCIDLLGVSYIDYVLLHNVEEQFLKFGHEVGLFRTLKAFEYLESRVGHEFRAYGVSSWSCFRLPVGHPALIPIGAFVARAGEVAGEAHSFRVIQLPINICMGEAMYLRNHWIERDGEFGSTLEYCQQGNLAVFASAPLAKGSAIHIVSPELKALYKGNLTPSQLALQFVRSLPGVTCGLVGMVGIEHVAENLMLNSCMPEYVA